MTCEMGVVLWVWSYLWTESVSCCGQTNNDRETSNITELQEHNGGGGGGGGGGIVCREKV